MSGGVKQEESLPPTIPWSEFVANPDIVGMLLQIPIPPGREYQWGRIRKASFDGEILTLDLYWITDVDPRREKGVKRRKVEPVVITPRAIGPFYLSNLSFAVRDTTSQQDFYIHPWMFVPSGGRLTRRDHIVHPTVTKRGGFYPKKKEGD